MKKIKIIILIIIVIGVGFSIWYFNKDKFSNLLQNSSLPDNSVELSLQGGEYKNEAYSMFERLIAMLDYEITRRIYKVQVQLSADQLKEIERQQQTKIVQEAKHERQKQATTTGTVNYDNKKKLGRNDPCWCDSGKKWKRCHYPDLPS